MLCIHSSHDIDRAEFPDEKVPSLEEMIVLCLELKLKMYIDVKGSSKWVCNPETKLGCRISYILFQSVEALPTLFQKYPELYKNAIVCSFFPQIVYLVSRCTNISKCSL
jgi:glycerophosphoinositol glycerophosphodiesterase